MSAVYVGAFAMAAGEQRAIDGRASVFGIGGGAASQADVEVLGDEGDAESCKASQKEHKENAGCAVPLRVGFAPLDAPAAPAAASAPAATGPLLCGRFQLVDAGNGIKDSGTGLVRDTKTGLTWARFRSEHGKDQAAASAYCSRKRMRLPTMDEAASIAGSSRCREAWPEDWWTWTSSPGAAAGRAWNVIYDGVTLDLEVGISLDMVALCVR